MRQVRYIHDHALSKIFIDFARKFALRIDLNNTFNLLRNLLRLIRIPRLCLLLCNHCIFSFSQLLESPFKLPSLPGARAAFAFASSLLAYAYVFCIPSISIPSISISLSLSFFSYRLIYTSPCILHISFSYTFSLTPLLISFLLTRTSLKLHYAFHVKFLRTSRTSRFTKNLPLQLH